MQLDVYARRVREGIEVLPAADFARWLKNSGVMQILDSHEQEVPLPIRARELRVKCNDLLFECGEWLRLHARSNAPRDPLVPRCELENISERLLAIERVLKISTPLTEKTADVGDAAEPVLRVIRGVG